MRSSCVCGTTGFSALQRAENSSMSARLLRSRRVHNVSALFSEPKIPQSDPALDWSEIADGFSALQRAENSSIQADRFPLRALRGFSALQRAENSSIQPAPAIRRLSPCFSALQRAENSSMVTTLSLLNTRRLSFSALQRAENSSIVPSARILRRLCEFQCSSASRKFLNPPRSAGAVAPRLRNFRLAEEH